LALALLVAIGCACSEPEAGVDPASRAAVAAAPPAGGEAVQAPAPAPSQRRGLWVLCEGSQRALEHPDRIDALLRDARELGVSDLFVQVYRGGRAWYPSTLADSSPHRAVFRSGGRDGLEILIERAHAQRLRVHGWVNVLSLAGNPNAPILERLGRDAVAVDQKGRSILDYPEFEVPQPDRANFRLGTPAVWLDPGAPGVAEELTAAFEELVRVRPGLDGLHLDYVRYPDTLPFSPGTRFGVGLSFGFGESSRARFRQETGVEAPVGDSIRNANRWDDWRRQQVTDLVGQIAARTRAARPGLLVSAAVVSDRERAYLVDFQDWAGWLDRGHLDFAVPMLYTRDPSLLRYGVESLAGLARHRELWVGLGSWLFAERPAEAVAQLQRVTDETNLGSALFSWDSIRDVPALRAALADAAGRPPGAAPAAPVPPVP